MTPAEAVEVCQRWFAHIEAQRARAAEMQRLSAMARNGQADEARRLMAKLDRAPVVFDGAALEPAVRTLVRTVQSGGAGTPK